MNKIICFPEALEKRNKVRGKAQGVYLQFENSGVAPRDDRCGLNPSPVTLLIKPDTPKAVVVRELKNIMKFIQTEPDLLKIEPFLEYEDDWKTL